QAEPGDAFQLTAVGERWVVLDATTRELATEAGVRSLAGELVGTGPRVQLPGPDAERVLVADSLGLVAAGLSGGEPRTLVDDAAGVAAAPLVVNGCAFAAWSSGLAWRGCGGEEVRLALARMPGAPALGLATGGTHGVLSDRGSRPSRAVQVGSGRRGHWDAAIVDEEQQTEQPDADEETPPELEELQKPPVAVDDTFGARPGRATVLPVLLNDFDPNGDLLVVTQVDAIDEAIGRLDLVSRNQQVQLTLSDTASGVIRFGYTISDGRGGSASAVITVEVRSPEENSPPRQVRTSTATVGQGDRVSTQVSGDWVDPDGDAIYLTGAAIAAPDQVAFKPDGVIVFVDGGEGTGIKTVAVTMSDGRASTNGTLQVTVKARGEVPILVEPCVALASSGEEITVRPLQHVRGGNGPIRLGGVPPKAGTSIVASFEAGTFTFLSEQVGTHYIEFTVTDGTQTAT